MAGKIRSLFTDADIQDVIDNFTGSDGKFDHNKACVHLSDLRGVQVRRQLLSYWIKKFEPENTKANGNVYSGTTALDRKIRDGIALRIPSRNDDTAITASKKDNSCILVIPDQHAPYHHPDALTFLADVAAKVRPTRIVNLGDETDSHALSMHDSDPSLDSAGPELAKAQDFIYDLSKMFPVMEICHSNHGSLIYRRAFKSGIPASYIKSYRDFLFPNGGGDGWEWADEFRITLPNGSDVVFRHHFVGNKNQVGHGLRANICQGHEHGKFYVVYDQTTVAQNWSLLSGCLIDPDALAFAYGKMYEGKPIIGCSAIINSQPITILMPLNSKGRYTGKLDGIFE